MAAGLSIDTIRAQLAQYHEAAYVWSRCCCKGDAQEAEEVLQYTYLKILEGKACFRGESAFKTWLFAVIRRTASERRRRRVLRWLRLEKNSAALQPGDPPINPRNKLTAHKS